MDNNRSRRIIAVKQCAIAERSKFILSSSSSSVSTVIIGLYYVVGADYHCDVRQQCLLIVFVVVYFAVR